MNIYPSLINAPLLNLEQTIKQLEPWCAGFHLDIMDFHFVPNLTWGPLFINAIRKATYKKLWIHLMVDAPSLYITTFRLSKGDIISIHQESATQEELKTLFKLLHSQHLQASLALNPETSLREIIDLIPYLDQVLLMSVQPGFSGQIFLRETYARLQQLQTLKKEYQASFSIALDGGITETIFNNLAQYDVDDIAMASALFNQEQDPATILKKLSSKV
ncbi:MAG: ribulose-phosphate 3-epimerase [Candidatus Babeliaceae bacterium]